MSQPRSHPAALTGGQIGELFFPVSDAVAILDRDWTVRRWNPAAQRLLGYSEPGPAGQPLVELFPDRQEFERARRMLEDARLPEQGRFSEPVPTTLRSRAGRLIRVRCRWLEMWGEANLGALLVQEIPPVGLEGRAPALVRQLNLLAEAAALSVGATESERVAQTFTDLAKEVLEADFTGLLLTREKEAGDFEVTAFTYSAPRHLFPPDADHPEPKGVLRLALETRSAVRLDDARTHPEAVGTPDHHPPIGPLLAVPLLVGDRLRGELLAANLSGRTSFTEVHEALAVHLATFTAAALENARLQRELAATAEELAQAAEQRRNLVAAIAHDLRAPLGAVFGYADLAADPQLPENRRPLMLERIKEQSARLARLVDDLATASHLTVEGISVRIEPVALDELLESVAADYRQRFPERGFTLAGAPVPLVAADSGRLEQVFTNLFENALKYTAPDTPIELGIRSQADRVVVEVQDHGRGMEQAELPRIFEPFFRSPRSTAVPGLGLGLTIVRGLMEAMGGGVEVSSGPQGTRFSLFLKPWG